MPELDSLVTQAGELSAKVDFWNTAVIWCLIATFVAAGFIAGSQHFANLRSKELSGVQARIDAASKAKFEIELEKQRGLTAKAQADLAELQRAGLPRNLDVAKTAKKLRGFEGTPVSFESLMEFEPSRTMGLIQSALKEAKWAMGGNSLVSGIGPMTEGVSRPGVWIEVSSKPGPDSKELSAAATALIEVLNAADITAKLRPSSRPDLLPDGAIHIFVGLKPFPGMPDDLRVIDGR
jgi:hypothetical protein